jgi:hypothetical protein
VEKGVSLTEKLHFISEAVVGGTPFLVQCDYVDLFAMTSLDIFEMVCIFIT